MVALPIQLKVLEWRRPWQKIPQQRFQAEWLQNPILKGLPESGHSPAGGAQQAGCRANQALGLSEGKSGSL